jgi:thiol-disulfide isomerase/thioredoxin
MRSNPRRFFSEVIMKYFLAFVAAVALAAPAFSLEPFQNASGAEELKPLPQMNLQDFDGKKVESDGLKGNVLVLDFWATWCGPCIAEIPTWNKLQQKYGDKGLKVVGITMASGDAKEVKPFVARRNMQYTVLMGDDDQSYDFNILAFPTTFVVTRDMKVYRRYVGTNPRKSAQIEADVQKLLEQKR